jgi:hypothetical protein
VHTFGGYFPVLDALSSSQLADSYYAAVSQAVITTGDAAQAAYLLELMNSDASNFCEQVAPNAPVVPNQNYAPLVATMSALMQSNSFIVSDCNGLWFAAEFLYNAEVQKAKVPNSLVTLTITDPNAATTTTTTTTSVAADPVAPAFTG